MRAHAKRIAAIEGARLLPVCSTRAAPYNKKIFTLEPCFFRLLLTSRLKFSIPARLLLGWISDNSGLARPQGREE